MGPGVQVFVDFFAEWCGPCKMVSPKIEELSNTYPGIIFVKVDVDQAQVSAQGLHVQSQLLSHWKCLHRCSWYYHS